MSDRDERLRGASERGGGWSNNYDYGCSGTEEKKARCVEEDGEEEEEVVGSVAGVGVGVGPCRAAVSGRELGLGQGLGQGPVLGSGPGPGLAPGLGPGPEPGLGGSVGRGGTSMYPCLQGGVSDEEDEKVAPPPVDRLGCPV